MRQVKRPIDFLFPRVRQAALAAFLSDPQRLWYRSDLAKHLKLSPSSLQRELEGLVRAGVLMRTTQGSRTYFKADPACPFIDDLRMLIEKTVGHVAQLSIILQPFKQNISVAFIFGSIAKGSERSQSDVDLMVIGAVGVKQLVPGLREVERRLGRPVNIHTYTPKEVAEKVRAKHHFLTDILSRDKLYVIGSDHEVEALRKPKKTKTSRDLQVD